MLLRRAIESVVQQTYQNWVMVIVNDGGDPAEVEDLVGHYSAAAAGRISVLHNPQSLGMEGASKVGLDAIEAELLIFHDDDDSWAPQFLAIAVHELLRLQERFPNTQGVTTYSHLVRESVHGNLIAIDSVEPFNADFPAGFLSLDRMLAGNFIPPISFLFSRKAYLDVGPVYEAIPYLGDWDFLIRFLSRYDVYMIPQLLAFYHWRHGSEPGGVSNTVTAEIDQHMFYRQYLLNTWLRADLASGRMGVGTYANLRRHLETLLTRTEEAAPKRAKGPASPPDLPLPPEPPKPAEPEPLPDPLPGEIVDYYWDSASWRILRPLRLLASGILGRPAEQKPVLGSVLEAWQLARTLQESWSWQITAPVRWCQAVTRLFRRGA